MSVSSGKTKALLGEAAVGACATAQLPWAADPAHAPAGVVPRDPRPRPPSPPVPRSSAAMAAAITAASRLASPSPSPSPSSLLMSPPLTSVRPSLLSSTAMGEGGGAASAGRIQTYCGLGSGRRQPPASCGECCCCGRPPAVAEDPEDSRVGGADPGSGAPHPEPGSARGTATAAAPVPGPPALWRSRPPQPPLLLAPQWQLRPWEQGSGDAGAAECAAHVPTPFPKAGHRVASGLPGGACSRLDGSGGAAGAAR